MTHHPYDPLSADEITAAVAAVRSGRPELVDPRFPIVRTDPPAKEAVRAGAPSTRAAFLVVYDRADAEAYEARVDLATGAVTDWTHRPGVQPAIMLEEIMELDEIVKKDRPRSPHSPGTGVRDLDLLQVDPWSTGTLPIDGVPAGRRIMRASAYVRDFPEDNGYAHPVGNLVFIIDCADRSVIAIQDGEPIPVPPERGNYDAGSVGPLRTDLRPLDIRQPDGPSFTVDGHVIEWQRWRLHAQVDSVEGLVISDVSYLDGERRRSILHRAGISEMVVPYGDTSNDFYFRNVFDAGEYNLGRTVGSLALGCDCLGEIRYLDAVFADESGTPHAITNAICIHEEDYGILWKHWNFRYTDRPEVRRSRRLVVSAIHTLGNYEYGFFWYFYLDGTIQFEAKLTGIVQTRAVAPGATPGFGTLVAPQLDAPNHQHLFSMRLDLEVDGPDNTVLEVDAVGLPMGPGNEYGNAIVARKTVIANERDARRSCDPATARTWKVVNPNVTTASASRSVTSSCRSSDRPCSPRRAAISPSAPSSPATPVGHPLRRARDARRRRLPQPAPGDGIGEWVKQETRPREHRRRAVAHVRHLAPARPEDWPIMPCDYVGFTLKPAGSSAGTRPRTCRRRRHGRRPLPSRRDAGRPAMSTVTRRRTPADGAEASSGAAGSRRHRGRASPTPAPHEMPIVSALDSMPGCAPSSGCTRTCARVPPTATPGSPAGRADPAAPRSGPRQRPGQPAQRAPGAHPVVNVVGDHASWHLPYDAPLTSDIAALASTVGSVRTARRARRSRTTWSRRDVGDAPAGRSPLVVPADLQQAPGRDPLDRTRDRPPARSRTTASRGRRDRRGARARRVLLLGGPACPARPARRGPDRRRHRATLYSETFPARAERGGGLPRVDRLPYFPETAVARLEGPRRSCWPAPPTRRLLRLRGHAEPPGTRAPGAPAQRPGQDGEQALLALAERLGGVPRDRQPPVEPDRPRAGAARRSLTGRSVGAALAALLPEPRIVSIEGGTCGYPSHRVRRGAAHTCLTNTGGAIGQGLPVALGAALAAPDRPVVALQSDGSGSTPRRRCGRMAREHGDVVVLVAANHAYGVLRTELGRHGDPTPARRRAP
jgi:primary-amine oxidase